MRSTSAKASRSRRPAACAARHFRLAGAAPVRSRNGEQQSRQHSAHGLSRRPDDFPGRRHAAHRRSGGQPGSADAEERSDEPKRDQKLCRKATSRSKSVDAQDDTGEERSAVSQHGQREPRFGSLDGAGERIAIRRRAASLGGSAVAGARTSRTGASRTGPRPNRQGDNPLADQRRRRQSQHQSRASIRAIARSSRLQQVNPIYAVLHASSEQVARIENGAPATVTAPDVIGAALQRSRHRRAQPDQSRLDRLSSQGDAGKSPPAAATGDGGSRDDRHLPVRGVRVPVTAFTDDNHDAVMRFSPTAALKRSR